MEQLQLIFGYVFEIMAEAVVVTTDPTDLWCRKMKTMFRSTVGNKGYITEEECMEKALDALKAYPNLDPEYLKEQARQAWINDLNCGMQPPRGYRLTEAQYVQNMWVMVNQPGFEERTKKETAKVMQQLDKDKKGYINREEFLLMTKKIVDQKDLDRMHDALDTTKSGRITKEDIERMYIFFFSNTDDEDHPFNLLRGPLVD